MKNAPRRAEKKRLITNVATEGQVTATTYNYKLTDDKVIEEIVKETDRSAIAVYRSEYATVIVSQMVPLQGIFQKDNRDLKDFYPREPVVSTDDGWPEG
jgi:hypothetical protein